MSVTIGPDCPPVSRVGRDPAATAYVATRSVDDQVEWLDNDRILYGLIKDVWVVRADGSGEPRIYIPNALSPGSSAAEKAD